MSASILDSEPITRFIFSSGHLARQSKRVKPNAFLPNANGQTSIFRIQGVDANSIVDADSIWATGNEVAEVSERTLHARADIVTGAVRSTGLKVLPEEPPPRHGNIAGWPEGKEDRMELAKELADASTLVTKD